MLTLGWSDGNTFLPINSVLLSSEKKQNRLAEAAPMDKRTVAYKRRALSVQKGTQMMLELLKTAKAAAIPASYVLFDRWFTSPSAIHSIKEIGYDVIGMVKKTSKMFLRYQGEDQSHLDLPKKQETARAFPLSAFCRGRDHKSWKRDSRKSGLRPQSEQPQRLSLLAVHRFKFRGK